ncbi:MAG: ferrous iron transport protein A [Methanobrevibacter thaueri]|jgi:ferrous iron transport protein A|uniref:Ferrous iron transport protein A n=1 Tax=Methanobrevibacter thaueri TaxID=190975 RepID=A0A8T3V5F3_9EURY|nr:FeoA family protein [Methanobrevibacter thaueri]MBE6501803.1 ferrous iron transport protein A [Methanobrevibacter thaueri]MEE1149913.1 FeoA family protein [Methanobrevibacter sp.]
MTRTLKEVKPGETVKLVKYHDTGDIGLRRHLLGMGFVKGAEITVKKVATLGDPIEMSVKGYDVCLRKEEAENIEVE